jgi:signal peptidase II
LNRRAWAFGCAAVAFGLNLAAERALMKVTAGFTIIPGLANFTPAFNRGVSFSLFTQSTESGRLLLMAVLAVISAFVAVMAWRATTTLSAIAFGLILGGALGNLADRWSYGAVFDFLWLHLGGLSLFICNGADIAISAGVVLLLLDGMIVKPKSP